MGKKQTVKSMCFLLIVMMLIPMLFAGCGGKDGEQGKLSGAQGADSAAVSENGTSLRLSDMEHAKVGALTGSVFGEEVHKALPETEILYFNSNADAIAAMKSTKIDAIALDEPIARNMIAADDELAVIPEMIGKADYAFAFAKTGEGEALCSEMNEFLGKIKASGEIETIQEKWLKSTDPSEVETVAYEGLPATNGTLILATESTIPPFASFADGRFCGYEIELATLFCKDRGYALDIRNMNFDAILPAIQSGKVNMGCASITITEERAETTLFSEPDYNGGTSLVVVGDNLGEGKGFWEGLKESFEKTFIRENRWKMFLEGIGTTILITALAIILGTALGFLAFMICRNGNRFANVIAGFCIKLIKGLPVIVLLMILYYIVFGKVAISGVWVSVIAFTLVFGASVFGMIRAGIAAVGPKQLETAYALGYTNRKAFFRVILPQALPHFMPAYKGEITEIIKATAIVGYVAVEDLTKMGDIVRSRTYEAFFPLIAVAAIYFVIAAVLVFFVKRIEFSIDPKRRKKKTLLKGVDTHDQTDPS